MPRRLTIGKRDLARIDRAILQFARNRHLFENLAQSLVGNLVAHPDLRELIHFIKWRVKDEHSLREKLKRKTLEEKAKPAHLRQPLIDDSSLFDRVVDLAGVRILHLHTEQMYEIHKIILDILHQHRYELATDPTAHCWDVEYEGIFRTLGIQTESRESMYTTIHYDIVANQRTKITCELQVRSLMDEVWSEVSHRVSYPKESPSESCRDQLKVLARLTTGGTRLVDSIFRSHQKALQGTVDQR